MTKGYHFNDDGLRIWDGDRTVFTSNGRLANFLPTPNTYSFNAAFPDANKGHIGMWVWEAQPLGVGQPYGYHVLGVAAVGAAAQKWTNTIVLGDAPPGATVFLGRVRLTRTVNPTHSWLSEPLAAAPFAGLWMPINGSLLLEKVVGLGRALSIYIADGSVARPGPAGKLVAYLDQSVSGRCGGYRSWGDPDPSGSASILKGGRNVWFGAGATGQPLWFPDIGTTGRKFTSGVTPVPTWTWVPYTRHRWDGVDPPVYSDPTNFSSTYFVEVAGRFGRARLP